MQRFTITLSVAILLGLISAQTTTPGQADTTAPAPAKTAGFANYAADWTKFQSMQSKFLNQTAGF